MDKELSFGTNTLNKHPDSLDSLIGPPDPRFCNTVLAIMRVLHASGAADVLDKLRRWRASEGGWLQYRHIQYLGRSSCCKARPRFYVVKCNG